MEKIIIVVVAVLMLAGVGVWIFMESKPKYQPGIAVADLGRGHVPVGTPEFYNSLPPTSGPHYEIWTRAGILDTQPDDRMLIHSLEHGYVIMSYNCDIPAALNFQENEASISAKPATDSAQVSEAFKTPDCQALKDNLAKVFEEKGKRKLIVTPRIDLKNPITLTAWNHLLRLDNFDKKTIIDFIDAYWDQGPEKTME